MKELLEMPVVSSDIFIFIVPLELLLFNFSLHSFRLALN